MQRLAAVAVLLFVGCSSGKAPVQDPSGGPPACTRNTCSPQACGPVSDGCGATLDCGACAAGLSCQANVCIVAGGGGGGGGGGCVPTTCGAQGKTCGSISDGCGATLACGSCAAGFACTAANTCVASCTPTTCAAQGKDCGAIADGCGATLACGNCTAPQSCGARGTANLCEAPPPKPGETTWVADLPSADFAMVNGNKLATGPDGSTVVVLHTRSGGMLAKVDRSGRLLWQRGAPEGNGTEHRSVAVARDGSIYLAMNLNNEDPGAGTVSGGVVMKYGPDGTFWWQLRMGDAIDGVAADSHGGFAVATYRPDEHTTTRANTFIDHRNSEGGIVWGRTLVFSGEIRAHAIAFDPFDDVIVGGIITGRAQFEEHAATQPPVRGQSTNGTPYLAKLSDADNGWVQWVQTMDSYGSSEAAEIDDVGITKAGTVVGLGFDFGGTFHYAGTTVSANQQFTGFLAVAEHDGSPRLMRMTGHATPRSLAVDPAGSAYVVQGFGNCDLNAQHWNLAGDLLWTRTFATCQHSAFLTAVGFAPGTGPVFGGQFGGSVDWGLGAQSSRGQLDGVLLRLEP